MNIFIEKNDNTGLLNITSTLLFVCLLLTGIIFIHNSTIIFIAFADSDKGHQNKQEHDDNQSDHSEKSNNDKNSRDNNELSSGISNEDPHKGNKPPKGDEPPQGDKPPKGDEPSIVVLPSPPPTVAPPSPVIITNTVTAPSVSSSSNDKNDQDKGNEGPTKFAFVDSFFTDQTAQGSVIAETSSVSSGAQDIPPVPRLEVGPGEGDSMLAIVLINRGFSDVTSIRASLDFPPGFTANVSPKNVDNDTALATFNGLVNAGQTFTLYFPVTISKDTLVGKEYSASLKIRYFNVAEQDEEDTRDRTIKIPFKLSGKVILDAVPFSVSTSLQSINNTFQDGKSPIANILNLSPGEPNFVQTLIKNEGSASATGVIVEVTARDQRDQIDNNNFFPVSSGNSNTSTTVQQSTAIPLINSGTTTFNIGVIQPGGSVKVNPVIFASDSVGSILENIQLKISYNDAYGNKKQIDRLMGVHILPSSPQSGLTLSPTATNSDTIRSDTSLSGVTIQSGQDDSVSIGNGNKEYSNQTDSYPLTRVSESNFNKKGIIPNALENSENVNNNSDAIHLPSNANTNANKSIISLVAGRVDELKFNITNTNTNPITDVVIALNTDSNSMKILGDSKWNLNKIDPSTTQEFITSVFASKSLISSPVSFKVSIQYIYNNQVKSDTLNLGANVIGDITVNINDLAVNYIGGNPNLVGNILNKGNTLALFTTIELLNPSSTNNVNNQKLTTSSTPMSTDDKYNILLPASSFPQYLGDLEENSPLPFSIPLAMKNSSASGIYPVSLKVTYSDDLRNGYTVINNGTVDFMAPEMTSNQGQAFLGNYNIIFFVIVGIIAVIITIFILRRFKSKIKTKLLERELNENEGKRSQNGSQNEEDIEALLGGEDASNDENFKK